MTDKEKAKAYDRVLEMVKEFYALCKKCGAKDTVDFLEDAFPELKKSKDEEIRKALINVFATHKDYEMFFGVSVEDIHAWLERQGKHAIACSEEQMKVLNEVLNFAANHESPYWNDYILGTLNNLIRQLMKLKA
jgi:hypothetical protein